MLQALHYRAVQQFYKNSDLFLKNENIGLKNDRKQDRTETNWFGEKRGNSKIYELPQESLEHCEESKRTKDK